MSLMVSSIISIKLVPLILLLSGIFILLSGCVFPGENTRPFVEIEYPTDDMVVFGITTIGGTATNPDGNESVMNVEIKINDGDWRSAQGTSQWWFNWSTYGVTNGSAVISVRVWDGVTYSAVEKITVRVDNPLDVSSGSHKWAIFVAAANFPPDNESKLGNGGLYLAENMTRYLIENGSYSTQNIYLLFDDGWIRDENGYGNPVAALQQRHHHYNITYGAAIKEEVISVLELVIRESNRYDDSEVFIWIFNHGYGDYSKKLTGGKILRSSDIFVWDDIIIDKELGYLLSSLKSKQVCIIIDACYSSGFADKTIYNLPTSFLLHSGIPQPGRVIITGASKFRLGYASTTLGPLFSLLWFEGIKTGEADGFKPSFLKTGRLPLFMVKDGKVSIEEAFYFARYELRVDRTLNEFGTMQPQINDQYPQKGLFGSMPGLMLSN